MGVHMGANRAPITTREKVHLWVITLRVNFGQNYRDLGHFVRVTFMAKITGPYRVPTCAPHLVVHLFYSWSHHVLPSATLRGPQWAPTGHP